MSQYDHLQIFSVLLTVQVGEPIDKVIQDSANISRIFTSVKELKYLFGLGQ